jgi:hypothetical protein
MVIDGADAVWIDHDGVIRETDKAALYSIDEGEEVVGIKKWWAEKNGIEGDW